VGWGGWGGGGGVVWGVGGGGGGVWEDLVVDWGGGGVDGRGDPYRTEGKDTAGVEAVVVAWPKPSTGGEGW